MAPVEPGIARSARRGLVASVMVALLVSACQMDPRDDGNSVATEGPRRVSIGEVSWYVDYATALAVAREEDKALWVHFGENPG